MEKTSESARIEYVKRKDDFLSAADEFIASSNGPFTSKILEVSDKLDKLEKKINTIKNNRQS
jgi:hypothetical protein